MYVARVISFPVRPLGTLLFLGAAPPQLTCASSMPSPGHPARELHYSFKRYRCPSPSLESGQKLPRGRVTSEKFAHVACVCRAATYIERHARDRALPATPTSRSQFLYGRWRLTRAPEASETKRST